MFHVEHLSRVDCCTIKKEVHLVDALIYMDPVIIAYTALGLCVLALVIMLIIMVRQTRLLNRYRYLLQGNASMNLEELLLAQAHDIEAIKLALDNAERRILALTEDAKAHVQRIGVIRFNAFPDTGSDLSFAIAMLDAHDNGFVISSLYGRNESRTYAKPIRAGTSTYSLSQEEKEALAQAMGRQAPPT